jgi:hypothetical protein
MSRKDKVEIGDAIIAKCDIAGNICIGQVIEEKISGHFKCKIMTSTDKHCHNRETCYIADFEIMDLLQCG